MDLPHPRTARLAGEPVAPALHDELLAIMGDPRVAALSWPGDLGGPRTPEQVTELLEQDAAHWRAHGFGNWALREGEGAPVVATGGLALRIVGGRAELEVGWMVAGDRWGEGLATELGAAAMQVAFANLHAERLVAFTRPANHASLRVMGKLGFAYERTTHYAGHEHVVHACAPG